MLYTLPFSVGGIFLNSLNISKYKEQNILCVIIAIAGLS